MLGMGKNGVEHVAANGFVCRAVLLDAVACASRRAGRATATADKIPVPTKLMDIGVITADDVKSMLKAEGCGRSAARRLRLPAHRSRQRLGQRGLRNADVRTTCGGEAPT